MPLNSTNCYLKPAICKKCLVLGKDNTNYDLLLQLTHHYMLINNTKFINEKPEI